MILFDELDLVEKAQQIHLKGKDLKEIEIQLGLNQIVPIIITIKQIFSLI